MEQQQPVTVLTERSIGSMRSSTLLLKGKYRMERSHKLGQGSYGTVYRGIYESEHEHVDLAIKQIPLQQCETEQEFETFRRILESELRAHQQLRYRKHIVQLYDCVKQGNSIYLVMEYCEQNFQEFWSTFRSKDYQHSLFYFSQMLKGYDFLRRAGLLHHDIKPQNFLVSNQAVVKLCDFGLVECAGQQQYYLRSENRNYQTVAPEVRFKLAVNAEQSDVWSLGATLHWMLTGTFPYTSESTMQDYTILPGETIESIPYQNLKQTVRDCLQFDPAKRIDFQQLFALPMFQQHYLEELGFEFPQEYEQYCQLSRQHLFQQIKIYEVIPQSHSQTMMLKEVYLTKVVSTPYDQVELDEVRGQLKWQLHVHTTKKEFLTSVVSQIRKYSVLANKHKYLQQARNVNFYKKLLLVATRTYLLADYRRIVTLEFLDHGQRGKVLNQASCQPLLQQLSEFYLRKAWLHSHDNSEEADIGEHYSTQLENYRGLLPTVFIQTPIHLHEFSDKFRQLIADFLQLISNFRGNLDKEQLRLSHHLLLLLSCSELFAALVNDESCLELKRFAGKIERDRYEIPNTSVNTILSSFANSNN